MEIITDWGALWRELVEIRMHARGLDPASGQTEDIWGRRAHKFDEGVKRRWAKPDSSRAFILSQLAPDSTVLDIGAGTGAWASLLAARVKQVTAVEPSAAMMDVMRKSLAAENVANVALMTGSWPDVAVERHDYSLCSHAMYGCPDLKAFVARMVACTRRTCFLLLRAPTLDGVQAEAALHIYHHPLDSPNFIIAYNVLLQMGICANVLMEDTGLWEPKRSPSFEAALRRMKRHFGLEDNTGHDEYLTELLHRRLIRQDGEYIWPPEVRSALVYWQAGV